MKNRPLCQFGSQRVAGIFLSSCGAGNPFSASGVEEGYSRGLLGCLAGTISSKEIVVYRRISQSAAGCSCRFSRSRLRASPSSKIRSRRKTGSRLPHLPRNRRRKLPSPPPASSKPRMARPFPGATLKLTNDDTKQIWVSWTDESGKFEFPSITPGHYTIEATQLGFVSSSIEAQFSTPPPEPPTLQLSMHVATLAELAAPGRIESVRRAVGTKAQRCRAGYRAERSEWRPGRFRSLRAGAADRRRQARRTASSRAC